MLRFVLMTLACASVAACTTSSTTVAYEPQNRPLSAQSARIYVLRPSAASYSLASADVMIDGKSVGLVANNAYLSADRPAGRHTLTFKLPGDFGSNTHEFEAVAGRKYYFVMNMRGSAAAAGGFLVVLPGSAAGRPVEQSNMISHGRIGELDEAAGAAALSQLDPPISGTMLEQ